MRPRAHCGGEPNSTAKRSRRGRRRRGGSREQSSASLAGGSFAVPFLGCRASGRLTVHHRTGKVLVQTRRSPEDALPLERCRAGRSQGRAPARDRSSDRFGARPRDPKHLGRRSHEPRGRPDHRREISERSQRRPAALDFRSPHSFRRGFGAVMEFVELGIRGGDGLCFDNLRLSCVAPHHLTVATGRSRPAHWSSA